MFSRGNSRLIEFKSDIFAEDVAVWYSTSLQDGAQESILVKLLIDSIHFIPFPLQTVIFPKNKIKQFKVNSFRI